MKTTLKFLCLTLFVSSAALYSCNNDDNTPPATINGIPNDYYASANPAVESSEVTSQIPNINITAEGKDNIINMVFTGIQDKDTEGWLRLYGTNDSKQNVWVEVDGKPKGILVENVASTRALEVMIDLVFLVDNSGTMTEESDAVANDLAAWAATLASGGLDIKFACAGYDAYGLNGGIDFCELAEMDAFLNRPGTSGRTRTNGFEGTEAARLSATAMAPVYKYTTNAECGVRALRFADENFTFRYGANRIYVNLTDEPNQPLGDEEYSVEYVAQADMWTTNHGTIHTVYSDNPDFTEIPLQKEFPWRMSDLTGGTKMLNVSSTFTGVTLDDLPVTGAMANSYRIRFINGSETADGSHNVKVTVVSGGTVAVKEFSNVKFE